MNWIKRNMLWLIFGLLLSSFVMEWVTVQAIKRQLDYERDARLSISHYRTPEYDHDLAALAGRDCYVPYRVTWVPHPPGWKSGVPVTETFTIHYGQVKCDVVEPRESKGERKN
jgi:hypothetical protein